MEYQNYRKLFQFLKWIQLSFSFMIFILEMIELGAYLNYVDKVSHDDKLSNSSYKTLFFNSDLGSSLAKKYLYFVFSFNILSTGMYIALYQGSWTEKKGPFAWFEMLQLMLWFSAFMANLYDIFHGAVGLCQQYGSAYSLQQIPNEPLTVCGTYIGSIIFSSLIVFTYMITIWITWKVKKEKKKKSKIKQVKKVKIIKYLQNSESKEAARFVRVEQHDGNEKVVEFKGVVEVEIGKNDFDNNLDLEKNNDKEINNDDCKTNESIC
ncbi:hypothetical protein F8M41_007162 [Gigaspora margarita]|uniref:Uncharacterized protein n=1 Tax=Gigaspora margarita TaxID=4874 RepID=A0A8H4AWG7_GIGMA|nr:hypothetical protein F8M41_007162 [Gigaspora margarita]